MNSVQAPLEITDLNVDLYRQIHPNWIVNSRITSQAFRPTKKDSEKLSVALSTKTTAEAAFKHHSEILNFKTSGTWGISVKVVVDLEMKTYADPILTSPTDPAHAFIDFRGMTSGQSQQKADKLASAARDRGPLFIPPLSGT